MNLIGNKNNKKKMIIYLKGFLKVAHPPLNNSSFSWNNSLGTSSLKINPKRDIKK